MFSDEDPTKESREILARIVADIERARAQAAADIEKYGANDKEYQRRRWAEYVESTLPLRRHADDLTTAIADYLTLTRPPRITIPISDIKK